MTTKQRVLACSSLAVVAFISYFFFHPEYLFRPKSVNVVLTPPLFLHAPFNPPARRIVETATNHTVHQNSTTEAPWQPAAYPYYPQFPVITHTHFGMPRTQPAKLILLGNGIFNDPAWGLGSMGKSPKTLMTEQACPYLAEFCDITTDKQFLSSADAVVFHARDEINLKEAQRDRQPEQRFVFALWESPAHTPSLKAFKGFYNWTMTYRLTSHVVASYYSNGYVHKSSDYYQFMLRENASNHLRLSIREADHRPSDDVLAQKKLGTVAALITNRGGTSRRLTFVKYLQQYIDVTVYGKHTIPCPDDANCVEFIAKNYYFYLNFENSLCQDYTKKFFGMLHQPIVPVVLGYSNYSYFIPPSGYIDTEAFTNISALAQFLHALRADKERYLSYFAWKKDYIWNQRPLLVPFCELCLRLHVDSTPNVIDDIDNWWHGNTCKGPRKFGRLRRKP